MNRSNTSQSLSKSASLCKRRSVRQSTTRSRCVTTFKQDQNSCCQKLLPTVKQNENDCCQILLLTFKQARNNAIAGQDNVCNTVYDNKCETVYDTVQVQNRPPKPNFCKKTIFQEFYLANLFCKNSILQTYFAGGEMRVQIWHKVWNPIRHRIRRGKKNTFLYPVFSWPTPHPKVCRTETRTEFKTEYDDKWALIFFLASKYNLLLQMWDKVREQVRDSIRDGLRWSLWKCSTASLGSYEQSHKCHIAQRNDDNHDRVDKQEEYGAPAAPVVDSYGSPQAAPLAGWSSYYSAFHPPMHNVLFG